MNRLSKENIGFFYITTLLWLVINIICLAGDATSKLVLLESIFITIAIFYFTIGLILSGE